MQCIAKMIAEQIKSLEVKEEPTRLLNEHIDRWLERTVYVEDCRRYATVPLDPVNVKLKLID